MTGARRVLQRAQWAVQMRGRHDHHEDLAVHRSVRFNGAGAKIGSEVKIKADCRIEGPCVIGDGVYLNVGVWVSQNVTIGARCSIGPYCRFITDHHEIGSPERRAGASSYPPIVVGEGCWFGAGVTVLPGVTIGSGAVVGAESLVTRDVAANTLVVGSPARFVRDLPTE